MNHWEGYPDFWSNYEFKNVVETIWNNYKEHQEELATLLDQIEDSKSIMTIPYSFERKWLLIRWTEDNGNVAKVDFKYGRLVRIDKLGVIQDGGFKRINIQFEIDPEQNTVTLLESPPEGLKRFDERGKWYIELWAPVYYVHNPAIYKFFAPLLGIEDLERSFQEAFGLTQYSELYYRIVKGMWYIFVNGPTINSITGGLMLLFNIPFTLQPGTIISKTTDTFRQETTIELDSGEKFTYPSHLDCPYEVGDHVEANVPLVKGGVELSDYLNFPDWWDKFTIGITRDKLAVIEKFSTYLVRVDAPTFQKFQESGHMIPPVYASFMKRISPTFAKSLLSLFQEWADVIKHPIETIHTALAGVVGETEIKRRGELVTLYKEGGPFTWRAKCFEPGIARLIPLDMEILEARTTTGALLTVVKYDPDFIQVKLGDEPYEGIFEISYNTYDFQGSESYWITEHEANYSGEPFVLGGNMVLRVTEVRIDETILVKGQDYEVDYVRTNSADGIIMITIFNYSGPFTYKVLRVPQEAEHYVKDTFGLRGVYDPDTYSRKHPWPSLVKYPSYQLKPSKGE